MLSTLPYYML